MQLIVDIQLIVGSQKIQKKFHHRLQNCNKNYQKLQHLRGFGKLVAVFSSTDVIF